MRLSDWQERDERRIARECRHPLWLRAENRRQKAEYRLSVVDHLLPNAHDDDVDSAVRAHRAALRALPDRLAQRKSFSEAAGQVIWGQPGRAYWRRGNWLTGEPEIIDRFMAKDRPDVAGVLKSELVWAHKVALIHDCVIIGPPSPLPG